MAKSKVSTPPNTRTLLALMEEYGQMLRDAERGIKKVLPIDPQKEEFWDELSDLHPLLTLIESRSAGIVDEIEKLIDQLPED